MPVESGEVFIDTPPPGSQVVVGTPFRVAGSTTPGTFTRPDGTFEAELPPSSVRLSVDGSPPLLATQLEPDWRAWEANVQVSTPGPHTIDATARRGSQLQPVWSDTASITVSAVVSRVSIAGIERTQATQFFLFNGQGSGAAADNTVSLVAQKSMVLRVYIDSTAGQPAIPTVTGELVIDGSTLVSSNGPITSLPAASINRGAINNTLNFWLQPSLCSGTKSCTLKVFDPTRIGDLAFQSTRTFSLTFQPVPRPRVHGVLVHYTGLGFNIPAPTDVDVMNTLSLVQRMYPIAGFDYSGFTVITFNGDLTQTGGGGCGVGWNQLFTVLSDMRSASKTTDVYVGLLPVGVPTGNVGGCGGGGVAIGYVGRSAIMAQEIGHAFGRQHAPCGSPPNVDTAYPTFNMYPSASIGEFGVDTGTFSIFNPATTFDFMSYCSPTWISPYTYTGLMSAIISSPAPVQAARAETGGDSEVREVTREYLHLSFRVYRNDDVQILPSFHLLGPTPSPSVDLPSSISLELIGRDGESIASSACHLNPHHSPSDPYMEFHESLPWDPAVQAVRFWREREMIHVHDVEGDDSPIINIEPPIPVEDQADTVRLEWSAEMPPGMSLTYLLRYSNDAGESWRALATGLTETQYVADLGLLAGGERCHFQVAASSGIRTAVAETPPFALPIKGARAKILSPAEDVVITESERLELRGIGFSPDFGTTRFEDMVWSSSRDGLLDHGHETFAEKLSPGRHRIELTVPDGLGGESTAMVAVEVRPRNA